MVTSVTQSSISICIIHIPFNVRCYMNGYLIFKVTSNHKYLYDIRILCLINAWIYDTMATRRHSRRRTMPYDLDNPNNWMATQLRQEISKLGVNLTASVPKTN